MNLGGLALWLWAQFGPPCLGTFLLSLHIPLASFQECSSPLGLKTGEVLDWQLSASSSYPGSWDKGCHMKYARLNQPNGKAWCAGRKAAGEWLLVDLGVQAKISGVITQGKCDGEEWVTKFQLSYSTDAYKWHFIRDLYNNKKVFHGNRNSHEPKVNLVEPSVTARFVRIHVIDWHAHPSLRIELLGCQECKTHISEGIHVKVSSSSTASWKKKRSCQPYDAALTSGKGWCARRKKKTEWLEFDLGPPHMVTGVITMGRGDSRRKQWVRSYSITYSNDSKVWFTYKDGNHLDPKVDGHMMLQLFGGNMDKTTERRHYLNSPFTARFVRINPQKWHKSIAMRAALLGCPHRGECGKAFFRRTEDTPCVENLAYDKKTWVNDVRHRWLDWTGGKGSLAVDGREETYYNRCAVVHNHNSEEPIWMVDLTTKKDVNGVILVTWQIKGQEQQPLYRDYVFALERLSVFVEKKPRLNRLTEGVHHHCATVSRLNNALFRERIHLECPEPMKGRYVYIKGSGIANRQNRTFSLVLCEVLVY